MSRNKKININVNNNFNDSLCKFSNKITDEKIKGDKMAHPEFICNITIEFNNR